MYCTLDDIKNVISERDLVNLTVDKPCGDNSGTNNNPCARKLPQAMGEDIFMAVSSDADSMINGYLRARYKLPLNGVPQLVKTIAVDICAYRLYSRRSQKIPEHIVNNYNTSLKMLQDIKKGNILLEATGENDEVEISNIKSSFRVSKTKKDKIFSDRMMKGFRGF